MKDKLLNKIVENFNTDSEEIDLEMFMGYVSSLIFSREVFKYNPDISPFLDKVLSVEFKPYVMGNRNLICAKTLRHIHEQTEETWVVMQRKLIEFAYEELNRLKNEEVKNISSAKSKVKKKKNANDKFDTWLKGF